MDTIPPSQPTAAPATTTAEEQKVTARRQNINLIWELTQALIAIAVTIAEIYAAMKGKDSPAINNAFTLIVAIYFVRTNHTRMGGVGLNEHRS